MDPNSPTDAELVTETLSGRREPFGELYDRYARIVASVVAGVSGDWSTVDDMVQESFLRAYRNLAKLREPARFGPWITGIARQVGRERRRALRRDRHEFYDPQSLQLNSQADIEAQASDRDEFEQIMRSVAGLVERERLAIHAFFLQQQDALQAAELLGLSRSGFYATVQRAIARLTGRFAPQDKEKARR